MNCADHLIKVSDERQDKRHDDALIKKNLSSSKQIATILLRSITHEQLEEREFEAVWMTRTRPRLMMAKKQVRKTSGTPMTG